MPTIAILAAHGNGLHPDPGIRAVEQAGGHANVISPSAGVEGLEGAGGLLVPDAGFDSDVHSDGAALLLDAALAADMPILLTGKGMHLLNATFGGEAPGNADIPRFTDADSPTTDRQGRRQIYLSPGSKMAAIIGSAGMFRVQSRRLGVAGWRCGNRRGRND